MIRVAALSLVVAFTVAPADASPAPDLILVWNEGEMSKDMSMTRSTFTVTKRKLHYSRRHSGRDTFMSKPKDVDSVVKDPKKLAAALASFDKVPVKRKPKDTSTEPMMVVDACLTRGTVTRCVTKRGTGVSDAEMKAIEGVRNALQEALKPEDRLLQ